MTLEEVLSERMTIRTSVENYRKVLKEVNNDLRSGRNTETEADQR
jgi:hypothetical protein